MVINSAMAEAFDKLSSVHRAKLEGLFLERERGGEAAFDAAFQRLMETDLMALVEIVTCVISPKEWREALEAAILDRGQTNAEFLAELGEVQIKH